MTTTQKDESRPEPGEGFAEGGPRALLAKLLATRLGAGPRQWWNETRRRIAMGVSDDDFARLLSLASRHAPRHALEPTIEERRRAAHDLRGWNPERWSVLETLRVSLVLERADISQPSFERALEEAFRYADEGELTALYRCLAFLPVGERFVWRAKEGCRTNIRPVFEAVACDTPYPSTHFEELAWNQMVIKALFMGAPVWRIFDLDARLSPELARMALDLADERRSAGRRVQTELWMCLGPHGGGRAVAAIELELSLGDPVGRRAAALALARAGEEERIGLWLEREQDPGVIETMRRAMQGHGTQSDFALLERSA
jgi:hypothetical protein